MTTIQIRTEIPWATLACLDGAPRSRGASRTVQYAVPIFAASAQGATIEDVDGNRYLDFAGGIGCLNIGHQAPRVLSAIQEQLEKHLHLCFAVTPYESYIARSREAERARAGQFRQEDDPSQHGRRSGRERRQDRSRLTPSVPPLSASRTRFTAGR